MFKRKNNYTNNTINRKPKYGMRKLSVGFVSCLLSFTIVFGSMAQPVHLIENSVWAEESNKQTETIKENIIIEAYRGGTTVKFKLPKSVKEGDTLHASIIPSDNSGQKIETEKKDLLLSMQDIANKEVSINASKPLEIGDQISAIILFKPENRYSLDNVVFNVTEETPLAEIPKPTYVKAVAGKESIKVGLPSDVRNDDIINVYIGNELVKYALSFKEGKPRESYINLSKSLKENENIEVSIIRAGIESKKESVKVRAFKKPVISPIDKNHPNIEIFVDEEVDSIDLMYDNDKRIIGVTKSYSGWDNSLSTDFKFSQPDTEKILVEINENGKNKINGKNIYVVTKSYPGPAESKSNSALYDINKNLKLKTLIDHQLHRKRTM